MRRTHSFLRGRSVQALLVTCGFLAAAAAAFTSTAAAITSTAAAPTGAASAQSLARVTEATTGLPDASSVVALNACGTPTAVRAACLAKVLGVRGTRSFVHPRLRPPASPDRVINRRPYRSHIATPLVVPAAAAPQPGTPAYLQQAYDLAWLSENAGKGATIAIVDAYDAPHAEADLATYRAEFSLPACTTANRCFRKVDHTGGTNYPTTTVPDWEIETSLDLDAVSALCPNCHIVLVEATSYAISDMAAAQAEAAKLGANVISDSWAVQLSDPGGLAYFSKSGTYTFPGITTVAASGDFGYQGSSTNYYPAALGSVAAAGGTTLTPASSARGFDESAWSGDGSGCVSQETKPAWQTDLGCGWRAYTDLSADGDPYTGMQVYDSDSGNGGWLVVGGTSEAAPLIAAYYALVGSASKGPAWAYAHSGQLNDPTTGSNGSCDPAIAYICSAGAGYDGPTGVGSISGAVIAGAPGIGGPGPNGSYTQSVSTATAQLQGGVYPNGTDTQYWWEYGTSTAYGQQTAAIDIGAGTAPVSVSDTLAGLEPNTTYHYRLVAQNVDGTEYGYDFTLTTPSPTPGPSNQGSGSTGTGTTPSLPLNPPSTTTITTGTTPTMAGASRSSATSPAVNRLRVVTAGARTATISAAVATGSSAATYLLQYGASPALGRSIAGSLATSATRLRATLRNLSPGRIYYLRALVSNAAGSATSTTIAFRTSPVTISRLIIRGDRLQAVLSCHGSKPCRVRLEARLGSRLIGGGQVTIRGNRSTTATLKLAALTSRRPVKLQVLSSWNGYRAAVTATIPSR